MYITYKLSSKLRSLFALTLLLYFTPLLLKAEPLKILAIGNSITQADKNTYSYRYSLWKKLIDANVAFDFVGSHSTNKGGNPSWPTYKGKTFDSDNEGHYGWTADQLLNGHENEQDAGKLSQWLQGYTPDIVLLHAGTNDAILDQSLDGTIEELRQIIQQIRQKNPNVIILLAQVLPAYAEKVGAERAANIPKLNEKIAVLATQVNTDQSRVILVDQYSNFDPTPGADSHDGLHPNVAGEEKMAQKWFTALSPLFRPLAIGDELENQYKLQLYPTLVNSQPLQIRAEKLKPGTPVEIMIYSVDGKLVMQKATRADQNGALVAEIEVLSKLSAGMYITSIQTPENKFTRKFIVSR